MSSLGETFAKQLKWHRRTQGKSQLVVAGLAGINAEYVGQIERGHRVPSLDVVDALAQALDVTVADLLTDVAEPSPVAADIRLASELHRSLLIGTTGEGQRGATLSELRERVNHAWDIWQAAPDRYSRLAALIPHLISDVVLLCESPRQKGLVEHRLATDAYALLRTVARRINRPDLALIAADRGRRAAELADDPIRLASAWWNVAHALLGQKEPRTAEDVALAAIDPLRTYDDRASLAMAGALWLTAAIAAARSKRKFVALERVHAHAFPLAQRTGETNVGRTAFGPTNVSLHLVNIELEDGQAANALALADRIDPTPMASRERHTTLALDLARGHALRFEVGDSLLHLLQAEQKSPEELRYNAVAHDIVRRVLHQARPSLRSQVTCLAQRVGIEEHIATGHTLS